MFNNLFLPTEYYMQHRSIHLASLQQRATPMLLKITGSLNYIQYTQNITTAVHSEAMRIMFSIYTLHSKLYRYTRNLRSICVLN